MRISDWSSDVLLFRSSRRFWKRAGLSGASERHWRDRGGRGAHASLGSGTATRNAQVRRGRSDGDLSYWLCEDQPNLNRQDTIGNLPCRRTGLSWKPDCSIAAASSEDRGGGKECVRTGRSWGAPDQI